jgi:hypothetical protein
MRQGTGQARRNRPLSHGIRTTRSRTQPTHHQISRLRKLFPASVALANHRQIKWPSPTLTKNMRTVKVKAVDLLKILKLNRAGHRENYEKAFDGYRKECIRVLEQNLNLLKEGKKQAVQFSEIPPDDHTEDYDRVIAMLEMSVDKTIELTASDFAQYVQDNWVWKHSWTASNSKYSEALR